MQTPGFRTLLQLQPQNAQCISYILYIEVIIGLAAFHNFRKNNIRSAERFGSMGSFVYYSCLQYLTIVHTFTTHLSA